MCQQPEAPKRRLALQTCCDVVTKRYLLQCGAKDELAGMENKRLVLVDLNPSGQLWLRHGRVNHRVPMVVEKPEDAVQPDVNAGWLHQPKVKRVQLNATALGSVWSGSATGVKGLAHLSFERTRFDQLLAYSGSVFARAGLTASATGVIDPIDLDQRIEAASGSAGRSAALELSAEASSSCAS